MSDSGRRLRRVLAAACLAMLASVAVASAGPVTPSPPVPPLPPQPGASAHPCTAAPTVASTSGGGANAGPWRLVSSEAAGTGDAYVWPQYQVAVDPWQPCRMYRASDSQSLQRSDDSGATWTPVFHDGASLAAGTPAFRASALTVPAPGSVVLGEAGNGDSVVASGDAGATWTLRDAGLLGEPIWEIDAAPSDPRVMYATVGARVCEQPQPANALVAPVAGGNCVGQDQLGGSGSLTQPPAGAGPIGIFATHDAGASWVPGTLPPVPHSGAFLTLDDLHSLQVRVDPADGDHLWAMWTVAAVANPTGTGNAPTPAEPVSTVFESTDAAQTWHMAGVLAGTASEFLVQRSAHHRLRLWSVLYNAADQVLVSDDDGATWQASSLPLLNLGVLAVDPADEDRMLWLGFDKHDPTAVDDYLSTDGFITSRALPQLRPIDASGTQVVAPTPLDPTTFGASFDPAVITQADRDGNFYVNLASTCVHDGCRTDGTFSTTLWTEHSFWELVAASVATPQAKSIPVSTSRSTTCVAGAGGCTVATPMVQLRTCAAPSAPSPPYNGSLAFDGDALLYTQYRETGPAPRTGVIHRMDPRTCAALPAITVTFSSADLRGAAQRAGDPELATAPFIDEMSYDAGGNQLWLSLATHTSEMCGQPATELTGCPAQTQPAWLPLFTISLDGVGSGAATVAATYRFDGVHCQIAFGGEEILAVDDSVAGMWTCDPRVVSSYPFPYEDHEPGLRALSDGHPIDTCVSEVDTPNDIATLTRGAPGRLYIQDEDDQDVYEYDDTSCALMAVYSHRPFSEPIGEDEQMACDATSFTDLAEGHPTSVLWLRDATTQLITAYQIPDGVCPLPTALAYSGTAQVMSGAVARVCATLTRRGPGVPIAGETLSFSVDGRNLGSRPTDASGLACLFTPPLVGAGRRSVAVHFAGDARYLASSAAGQIGVAALPGLAPPAAPPRVLVGTGTAAGVAVLPGQPLVSSSGQLNPYTQLVNQPQPQPQGASAAQPVAAPNQDPEHQVAAALNELDPGAETSYNLSASSSRPPFMGLAAGAGALLAVFGMGLRWALGAAPAARHARAACGRRARPGSR